MNQQFLDELKAVTGEERLKEREPMSRHTTFRVGGAADIFVCPEYENLPDVIRLCRRYEEPYYIIGNGSNLLVGDKGIRGVVIGMARITPRIEVSGTRIRVGAGMLLSTTAACAAENSLSGMEFAAGIPGSVGGAVVMNAGAYGGEIKDIIEEVTVLDREGRSARLMAQDLDFGYRRSGIAEQGMLVTEAVFRLSHGEKEAIRGMMRRLAQERTLKQPLEYPSAGSTFKRPPGFFAGKLIMDAGLRGYRVGGAQVSEKHCGFVINREDATADDIRRLMREVAQKVEEMSGVRLEPEVKMIGEFS